MARSDRDPTTRQRLVQEHGRIHSQNTSDARLHQPSASAAHLHHLTALIVPLVLFPHPNTTTTNVKNQSGKVQTAWQPHETAVKRIKTRRVFIFTRAQLSTDGRLVWGEWINGHVGFDVPTTYTTVIHLVGTFGEVFWWWFLRKFGFKFTFVFPPIWFGARSLIRPELMRLTNEIRSR